MHETLQLVQAYEAAYRSFPFEPTHTEPRSFGVYYLEQVGALGVRQYTKSNSASAAGNQELGLRVVQFEPPHQQTTLDTRLLADSVANLQPGVFCVYRQAGTRQIDIESMPRHTELEDSLQQHHTMSMALVVCRGIAHENQMCIPADIKIAGASFIVDTLVTVHNHRLQLGSTHSAAGAYEASSVDIMSSSAAFELPDGGFNPALSQMEKMEDLMLPRGTSADGGVDLHWPIDGVAQLRGDMTCCTASEQLQAAILAAMQCSDLCAIVFCGTMHCFPGSSNLVQASLNTLAVPLLAVLTGRIDSSVATMTLACDWHSSTHDTMLGCSDVLFPSECLNLDHLLALGITHVSNTEFSVAIDNALDLACNILQAPPLGLQHCLHLARNTNTGLLDAQWGTLPCASCHATPSLVPSSTPSQMELYSVQIMSARVYQKPCTQLVEPFRVSTLCKTVPTLGELVHSTVCSQLGAVDDMLVTLSSENGLALLELNDARHYNAVSYNH